MLVSLALVLSSAVHAAPLKVASWTAGSTAPSTESSVYDVAQLGDGKVQKVWVEGDPGAGRGAWVTADFGAQVTVGRLMFWTGSWADADSHAHYGRPKVVVAEFSDGTTEEFTIPDGYTAQEVKLKAPKSTTSVKLKIKDVHSGKGPDTALSEVAFFDASADPAARVASAKASSSFSESYDPMNTQDGAVDSVWCEGSQASDGTGELVEYTFGGPVAVSKLNLRNGVAYNLPLYMKTNRPTGATLTFDDGSTAEVVFKDSSAAQSVSFAPHTTTKVRMTFTSVKKGTEYNDLCVADLSWLP